jgi:signal transduction histidine kinase
LLARLSDALASATDLDDVLRAIPRVLVPAIAESCALDLVEENGQVRRHLGAESPAEGGRAADMALLALPLVARGRVLGRLHVRRPAAAFDAETLALLGLMAAQVALAIDGARLVKSGEDVAGIVSHDLRNPLNVINLSLAALERRLGGLAKDESVARHTAKIRRAVERMDLLIADLLDMNRVDRGRLSLARVLVDPAAMVTQAAHRLRPWAAERGVTLVVAALPDGLPPVSADRGRLLQVLSNLTGNAIRFTPAGGTVELAACALGGELRFEVRDSGPGIPAEHLPRVFDRFWEGGRQTHQGAGISLAVARGIVLAHGGRIGIESTPGAGTVVHVTLAAASADTLLEATG